MRMHRADRNIIPCFIFALAAPASGLCCRLLCVDRDRERERAEGERMRLGVRDPVRSRFGFLGSKS